MNRDYYFIDYQGTKFGEWTILQRVGTNKHGSPIWEVRCDSCWTRFKLPTHTIRRKLNLPVGCKYCTGKNTILITRKTPKIGQNFHNP